jgi:hypothetical protein
LAAIVAIWLLIRIGYAYQWTGFGEEDPEDREGRPKKTLWDWLQLGSTLALPIDIAFFGTWFTVQQDRVNRGIEAQRAEQVTLQAYLDQMGTLLLDRNLHDSNEDSDVRRVASQKPDFRNFAFKGFSEILQKKLPNIHVAPLRFITDSSPSV